MDWVARVLEQLGWEDLGPSPLARWFNRPDGKLTWLPYNLGYEADGYGWWLESNVVSRKISGGTRSERGSETKSVLASWFGTWRLRGCNPYHALNSILCQPISAPV